MSNKFRVSKNAAKIMEKRNYLWLKPDGTRETHEEMSARVVDFVVSAETKLGGDPEMMRPIFQEMCASGRFIANTPTLVNAGRENAQLAACFVLPIDDSMESIMETIKVQALVQKSGGGCGFNFGKIRENGALIGSTGQKAAGPISVIKFMNYMMENFILQGGIRNGANMGILPDDHLDLEEFISFKHKDGSCKSFNVSIGTTDAFMHAVESDSSWLLKSRHPSGKDKLVRARDIFDAAAKQAWETGDPGLVFLDTVNKDNPTPQLGRLECSNPCAEQFLLPNEACTLGHLRLPSYFIDLDGSIASEWKNNIDWALLARDIEHGIRFLDDVVEVNTYSVPEIEYMHKVLNRKVGLGVLGFSTLLTMLKIPYNSAEAIIVAREIGQFIRSGADDASCQLGFERGSFGAFADSPMGASWPCMRNACRTTIAPTGTTAIISGVDPSIEPLSFLVLQRDQAGMKMDELHPLFEEYLDKLDDEELRAEILNWYNEHHTVADCPFMAKEDRALFLQAHDIDVRDHIAMQAVWQKHYADNGISKTINMPNSATVEDVKSAYMLAWKSGCKGITCYRDGSRSNQVLSAKVDTIHTPRTLEEMQQVAISAIDRAIDKPKHHFSTTCPECGALAERVSRCITCKHCGYSACTTS
jgi:ribonucleoside-diphosphate reductase alpha chain